MFVGTDVIEFINKIINQSDVKDKDKVKQNITKFREYYKVYKDDIPVTTIYQTIKENTILHFLSMNFLIGYAHSQNKFDVNGTYSS